MNTAVMEEGFLRCNPKRVRCESPRVVREPTSAPLCEVTTREGLYQPKSQGVREGEPLKGWSEENKNSSYMSKYL